MSFSAISSHRENDAVCKNHILEAIFINERNFDLYTNKTGWIVWFLFAVLSGGQDLHSIVEWGQGHCKGHDLGVGWEGV